MCPKGVKGKGYVIFFLFFTGLGEGKGREGRGEEGRAEVRGKESLEVTDTRSFSYCL